MKVLLAGLGYVGGRLPELLSGHEVWGMRRNPPGTNGETNVRVVAGDLSTGAGLSRLPGDIDQICVVLSPDDRTEEAYERAYPRAVEHLVRGFPRARILLVSSTTVYAQDEGVRITDASVADADTKTARPILVAERFVLENSPRACVLRSSGIYGPGRTRMASVLAHEPVERAPNDVFTSRIHRDDLAGALSFLVEQPEASGIFLATDLESATPRDIAAWLHARGAAKLLPVPSLQTSGRGPRKSRRMVPERLLALGYTFLYPTFRDGYGALLDAALADRR